MSDKAFESLYLHHLKATPELVETLYTHDFISASAKKQALNAILPQPSWQHQGMVLAQMLGIAFLISGVLLALLYQWPHLSTRYQLTLIMMGALCGMYGAFVYLDKKALCISLLIGALLLLSFLEYELIQLQRPVTVLSSFGVLITGVCLAIIYRIIRR